MFGWDDAQQHYDQVSNTTPEHQAKLSHEIVGGAAAFGAMKLYEDRQRKEGKPVDHEFAKEAIAFLVGAEVDRVAETKGEDFWDREQAKRHGRQAAKELYDQHYGPQGDQFDPQNMQSPQQFRNY